MSTAIEFVRKLYGNKFFSRLFHTAVFCLIGALTDCNTVLDLGCGPDSPLKNCSASYSVGVDLFQPYIAAAKDNKTHDDYIISNLAQLEFKPNSFDAVILIEVLEHLQKQDGQELLRKAKEWAKKKIVVSCPNGFLPQGPRDGNPHQVHTSAWNLDEMRKLGYEAYGMAGLKYLRKEAADYRATDKRAILSTIKFRPKLFWLMVSEISQLVAYHLPGLAFEGFYIRSQAEIRCMENRHRFSLY